MESEREKQNVEQMESVLEGKIICFNLSRGETRGKPRLTFSVQ